MHWSVADTEWRNNKIRVIRKLDRIFNRGCYVQKCNCVHWMIQISTTLLILSYLHRWIQYKRLKLQNWPTSGTPLLCHDLTTIVWSTHQIAIQLCDTFENKIPNQLLCRMIWIEWKLNWHHCSFHYLLLRFKAFIYLFYYIFSVSSDFFRHFFNIWHQFRSFLIEFHIISQLKPFISQMSLRNHWFETRFSSFRSNSLTFISTEISQKLLIFYVLSDSSFAFNFVTKYS